jgi:hypothetical protein
LLAADRRANMKLRRSWLSAVMVAAATLSGCAAYRTDSNITAAPVPATRSDASVLIVEGALPDRKYRELVPIDVSVKKLTIFHADPTRAQANRALIERARMIGADAVINVTYESGIGLMTWGYMDAKGTAVKFDN